MMGSMKVLYLALKKVQLLERHLALKKVALEKSLLGLMKDEKSLNRLVHW